MGAEEGETCAAVAEIGGAMRVPHKLLGRVPGSRWVYLETPLPPGVAGGGSVEIDGVEVPIILTAWSSGMVDRRRLRRDIRRYAAIRCQDGRE